MEFDFKHKYQDYTNIELLKITGQPDSYNPLALKAAEQILSQRNITDADMAAVEDYFKDIQDKINRKIEIRNTLKQRIYDFFEPIFNPSKIAEPSKIVRLFKFFVAIYSIFNIVQSIRNICYDIFNYFYYLSFIGDCISLVLQLLILFFILLRKKLGWILLIVNAIFSAIIYLFCYVYGLINLGFLPKRHVSGFGTFLFMSLLIIFLLSKSIREHYFINRLLIIRTFAISILGTVFYMVFLYVMFIN